MKNAESGIIYDLRYTIYERQDLAQAADKDGHACPRQRIRGAVFSGAGGTSISFPLGPVSGVTIA
jgi:hypothetical protein